MSKKIIVIEDDEAIRFAISSALQTQGYQVFEFEALDSLEQLMALNADCFVIDECLPHLSGHIIAILLRSKKVTAAIPILLISAFEGIAAQAGLCNAEAFLTKPFNIDELVNKVGELTGDTWLRAS